MKRASSSPSDGIEKAVSSEKKSRLTDFFALAGPEYIQKLSPDCSLSREVLDMQEECMRVDITFVDLNTKLQEIDSEVKNLRQTPQSRKRDIELQERANMKSYYLQKKRTDSTCVTDTRS